MYKMIAMDMDDTLLNKKLQISEENKKTILHAKEKGIQVVLCSGRASISLRPYLQQLDLDKVHEYTISYNGALIEENKSKRQLFHKVVSLEYTKELLKYAKRNKIEAQIYIGDDLLVEALTKRTTSYAKMTGMKAIPVGDLESYVNQDVIKVLFNGKHEDLLRFKEELEPWVEGKLSMFISKPEYLEFLNVEANKGIAILELGRQLGIKKQEIIAVGDSFNDLEMIKAAGLGVAVANAREEVKKEAAYTTVSNHEQDAIKEVIDKFIFNQ